MGIAMIPLLLAVSLVWSANSEPDISGYKVWRGTASRSYSQWEFVGNVTSNTVPALTHGKTYFFAVTALNTSGLESDFSNEVAVNLPLPEPPTITLTNCTESAITLTFDTDSGALYTVESIIDLSAPYWAPRLTAEGTGLPMEVSLPKESPAEYFRVRAL